MFKTLPLVITNLAELDLLDIADFISTDNPKRAMSFVRELRERSKRIPDAPLAAPLAPEFGVNIRKIVSGNYLILYTVEPDRVAVHSFYHRSRLPRVMKLQ